MINTASWPPLIFVSNSLCSFSLFSKRQLYNSPLSACSHTLSPPHFHHSPHSPVSRLSDSCDTWLSPLSPNAAATSLLSLVELLNMSRWLTSTQPTMSAAPTIQPNFLPSRHDVGVVAVGFSGGQVRFQVTILTPRISSANIPYSQSPVSMRHLWHSLRLA
jgi:hypothetical protein